MAHCDERPSGWEDGRPAWSVEFHLWCDEISGQLAELGRRAVRARGMARAKNCGLSLTVDASGVPVRGEVEDIGLGLVVLESNELPINQAEIDPLLWSQVVWAARATAKEAAARNGGTVSAPKLGPSPGGVWLVEDQDQVRETEATTARFARTDKTNEGAIVVSVDANLITTQVLVAEHPAQGLRFAWLLRHAGLMMRSWQTSQWRSVMADAPQCAGLPGGEALFDIFEPRAENWPEESPEAAQERESFLSCVEMDFWHEEPKNASLTEALRKGGC